jgi:hypothetical protein
MMDRSTVTVSRTNGLHALTATRPPFSFTRPLYTCPRDAATGIPQKKYFEVEKLQTLANRG